MNPVKMGGLTPKPRRRYAYDCNVLVFVNNDELMIYRLTVVYSINDLQ